MPFHFHHSATIWQRPPTCRAWTRGRQLYPETAPSSIAPSLKCFMDKIREKKTTWRGRIHVLKKLKVRRGCTFPSPLTWPSTKKSDGTKDVAATDLMNGCNVLPETQFVGTRLRVDTTRDLSVGGSLPPLGAAGERSEFGIKPPLGASLLIFLRGYLLKSFPQVDTSAIQRGLEIRVFPLIDELPKAIDTPARLPVIPLATRSQHVIFAYDQVVRPHGCYRPSGGLPREKPRTRRMWICLQLSGARGVNNGIIKALFSYLSNQWLKLFMIIVVMVMKHHIKCFISCYFKV